MTGTNELRIPDHWLPSREVVDAAQILGPRQREYRELRRFAIFCHCTGRPQRLVRFFEGPLDEDSSTGVWVLVNERTRGGTGRKTIPAHAAAVKGREGRHPILVAECRHCKKGILVIPCGEVEVDELLAQKGAGVLIITDAGASVRGETEARIHTGWRRGPLGTVVADFDALIHSRVDL